jgi:hypothetical protein
MTGTPMFDSSVESVGVRRALWVSLVLIFAIALGFYQMDALEAWVQWFAQQYVAPFIGLEA